MALRLVQSDERRWYELYSKLSHDITQVIKKAPIVEKQASMNFI
jgi:hypothetical protein